MKLGDFTLLARQYIHRTGYSHAVIQELVSKTKFSPNEVITADIGAGTGKLTENLIELGFKGFAIEPNESMKNEGIRLLSHHPFLWLTGRAEATGLPDSSVDLVFMGSSFHWTNNDLALKEFHRILKPRGFFIALWNPRDIESDPFYKEIEDWIQSQIPHLCRHSSGHHKYTREIDKILLKGGFFKNVTFIEDSYTIEMSKERYLGIWESVNDIRSQAGEEKFKKILKYISSKLVDKSLLKVPYKTRGWMVQASKEY
jgi:ubiquinone/menaquinone biosynthesis C-methylase UbiE